MPRRNRADPVGQVFGATVREIRQERGESLETVAGRILRTGRDGKQGSMDSKYLSSIEGGWHSPTIVTAKQIADALDVPLARLVSRLDAKPSPSAKSERDRP